MNASTPYISCVYPAWSLGFASMLLFHCRLAGKPIYYVHNTLAIMRVVDTDHIKILKLSVKITINKSYCYYIIHQAKHTNYIETHHISHSRHDP